MAIANTRRLAATAMLLGGLSLGTPNPAMADAIFQINNLSGLTKANAQFYFMGTGLGTNGDFYVLQSDGTWTDVTPAPGATAYNPATGWDPQGWNPVTKSNTGSGIVPCHKLPAAPNTGKTFTLSSQIISGRLYIFQVTSANKLFGTQCANQPSRTTGQVNGIFGSQSPAVATFSYTSTTANGSVVGPALTDLQNGNVPPWGLIEFSGSNPGDIDVSQVDAIGIPVNVTALQTSQNVSVPQWNQGVGVSFSSQGQVNMSSMQTSYSNFIAGLPDQYATLKPDYASLIVQGAGAGTNTVPFFVNPGKYVTLKSSAFATQFTSLVNNYIWKKGWTGTINPGGAFSYTNSKKQTFTLPQTPFSGVAMTLKPVTVNGKTTYPYPGYNGPVNVIQFSATINQQQVVANVLSPASYQALCKSGAIGGCAFMTPAYQIFAGAGALSTPTDNNQFLMLSPQQRSVWNNTYGGTTIYNQLVARLGLILSNAFNRGVAGGLATTGGLCDPAKYTDVSRCWSDQRNWYPDPAAPGNSVTYFNGDTSQNLFANWLHTAQISGIPIMTQPTQAIKSAGGKTMGAGYAFAFDENPTPNYRNKAGVIVAALTPSEYSGNVSMTPSTGCNYITVMPWASGTKNPTPVTSAVCNVNGPAAPN